MASPVPVFDGHNDVLSRLYTQGDRKDVAGFITGLNTALDLPKAKRGGYTGGFFSIYVPSPMVNYNAIHQSFTLGYDVPLPDPVGWEEACRVVNAQVSILQELELRGAVSIVRTVAELKDAIDAGRLAAIFHLEGAEAIDPDLHALDDLYEKGLRSLGPVWSRPTAFGDGVPFRFPSTGDIGAGLTDLGKRLVRRCNDLGILVDLSHLTEAGFWDVARLSDAPLVATHSNAHALCPSSRNLTDDQLRAIADSDGMVGLNFATALLRCDGKMTVTTPVNTILHHLDHIIGLVGEDRVGLGSDYDGATVPDAVATAGDLQTLVCAMRQHGYGAALIEKLCHGNWLRVLEKTWGG